MSAPTREDCAYAAFYCEENVWQLARRKDLAPGARAVIFISNPRRSVAMWNQQVSPPGQPVVWDYHVVLAVQDELQTLIYDLDARGAFPCAASEYLQDSFPVPERLPAYLQPWFRVVPVDELLARFSSDRSHMLDESGEYRAPVPPWAPIRPPGAPATTLMRFVDPSDGIAGEGYDLDGLRAWCGPAGGGLSS